MWLLDLRSGVSRVLGRSVLGSGGEISWAPGAKILYQVPGNQNFRLLDWETGEERPLVRNDSVGWIFQPQYSPDGGRVAVHWNRLGVPGLWIITLADESQLLLQKGRYIPVGWSTRSEAVYALQAEIWDRVPSGRRVYEFRLNGGEPKLIAIFPITVAEVRITRDGRRFVATAEETKSDVWVVDNFDPPAN